MENQRALLSIFIQGGAQKFIDNTSAVLMKKKKKMPIPHPSSLIKEFSLYNFIEKKPFILGHNVIETQAIKCMEGNIRSKNIFAIKNDSLFENINKFRLLYQKFISIPSFHHSSLQQSYNCQRRMIIFRKSKQFLSEIFQDQIIDKQIRQNEFNLRKSYLEQGRNHNRILNMIDMKIISYKNELEIFQEEKQLRKDAYKYRNVQALDLFYNWSEGQERINMIIHFHYERWMKQLCKLTLLKDISYQRIRIQGEWESNFIVNQEFNLISKRINGKMLYSIEQEMNKCKKQFQTIHQNREYMIRGKKQGINFKLFQKGQKMLNTKDQEDYKFHNYQINPCNENNIYHDRRQNIHQKSNQPKIQQNNVVNDQISVQSNIKNQRIRSQINPNIQKYYVSQLMAELPKVPQNIRSTQNNYKYKQQKINGPDIKIKQYSYNYKNSKQLSSSRQNVVNAMNSIPKKYSKKSQFKFPIKIQAFQMYSTDYSNICYKAENINLKELSLRFIQDRLKFGQNRVKVQYPFNCDAQIEEVVIKSMHILNCLGAQVYCEMESGYEFWNQVDQIDILTISLITQMPVKKVVILYGEFVGGKVTLK